MNTYLGSLIEGTNVRLEVADAPHCARVMPLLDAIVPIEIDENGVLDMRGIQAGDMPVCLYSAELVNSTIKTHVDTDEPGGLGVDLKLPQFPSTISVFQRTDTNKLVMRPAVIMVPSVDDRRGDSLSVEEQLAHEAEHFRHFTTMDFDYDPAASVLRQSAEVLVNTAKAERLAYRVSNSLLEQRGSFPKTTELRRAISRALPKKAELTPDTLDNVLLAGIKEYMQRFHSRPDNAAWRRSHTDAAIPTEPLVVALAEEFGGYDDSESSKPADIPDGLVYMYNTLGVLRGGYQTSKLLKTGATLLDVAMLKSRPDYTVDSLYATVDELVC